MTYAEYQSYMARYGFVECPLTIEQFEEASKVLHEDDMYGLGCDVNAGVDFNVAMKVNNRYLNR